MRGGKDRPFLLYGTNEFKLMFSKNEGVNRMRRKSRGL